MTLWSEATAWLLGSAKHRTGIRVMQVGMGLAMLFRAATEVPLASWLFGAAGVFRMTHSDVPGFQLVVSALFAQPLVVYGAYAVLAAGALLLIFGRATRGAATLCLVGLTLLELRNSHINDGGDNLARLCLGYMVLLASPRERVDDGSARAFLHNLGVVLIAGQLAILYFVAGLTKASGDVWTNGTAMYLIAQVDEFTLPWAKSLFANPFITVGSTYATVFFQLLFPIAIFSRFRVAFVLIALGFHVGIMALMGLVTFSLVMAAVDLALVSDDEYASLSRGLRKRLGVWRARATSLTRPIAGQQPRRDPTQPSALLSWAVQAVGLGRKQAAPNPTSETLHTKPRGEK